jgi:hypothetical protein
VPGLPPVRRRRPTILIIASIVHAVRGYDSDLPFVRRVCASCGVVQDPRARAAGGGATRIRLLAQPADATLTIVDDGRGMQRKELTRYHDVAASTKARGEGIGFAGVGIKLGLLVSREVDSAARADGLAWDGGATDLDESVVAAARRRLSRRDCPETLRAAARFRVRRHSCPLIARESLSARSARVSEARDRITNRSE